MTPNKLMLPFEVTFLMGNVHREITSNIHTIKHIKTHHTTVSTKMCTIIYTKSTFEVLLLLLCEGRQSITNILLHL